MSDREKAVLRCVNGRLFKGYLKEFSPESDEVVLEDAATAETHRVRMTEMKAVFFVKSFEGDQEYRERKTYGITRARGNRVFVKFRDGESLVGFLEGEVPWERGFFLSRQDGGRRGFFLLPVDEDVNNIKVFVAAASVADVTVVP